MDIDDLNAAAVGAKVDVVAIQREILLRVACTEDVSGRCLFERIFDQVRLDLDDLLLAVNFRSCIFPDF